MIFLLFGNKFFNPKKTKNLKNISSLIGAIIDAIISIDNILFPVSFSKSFAFSGGISISNIQRGVIQTGNIGYWMGEKFASNGYMYESISTLLPAFLKF